MQKFSPPKGLHIRPSMASDKSFLEKLHHAVRQDLQLIDGEQDFIESIVEMQYLAQTKGYGEQFPNAMYFIIEKYGERVGKATIDFGSNEVRLIEIAFLPEARGHGFGKAVIQSLQQCAAKAAAPMALAVEQSNVQAKHLYLSLGFAIEQVVPPYEYLVWIPPALKAFSQVNPMTT